MDVHIWKPVTEMEHEQQEQHLFAVFTNGKLLILDRHTTRIIDRAAMYYPLPDPPRYEVVYVEPDRIDNSWITDSKDKEEGAKEDVKTTTD